MTGLKIYRVPDDFESFIIKIKKLNIDSLFVGDDAAADLEFINKLKSTNIKVYFVFQSFYNPKYLEMNLSSYAITENGNRAEDEWVKFVCPTDPLYHIELKKRLKTTIELYEPDGISLDFIRQFVFWEKVLNGDSPRLVKSCSCPRCVSDKRESYEIITDIVKMLSNYSRELKKDIIVDLHAVPWLREEYNSAGINIAGQDLKSISKYVDFITPMCYSFMLKKDPMWINGVVKDHKKQSGTTVIPAIQAKECYLNDVLSDNEFERILNSALLEPSEGVIIWNWESIENSSKYDIALNVLGN